MKLFTAVEQEDADSTGQELIGAALVYAEALYLAVGMVVDYAREVFDIDPNLRFWVVRGTGQPNESLIEMTIPVPHQQFADVEPQISLIAISVVVKLEAEKVEHAEGITHLG